MGNFVDAARFRWIFDSELAAAACATAPLVRADLASTAVLEEPARGVFVADLVAFGAVDARREAAGLDADAVFDPLAGLFAALFAADGFAVAFDAVALLGFLAVVALVTLAFAGLATADFAVFAVVAFRVFVAVAFFATVFFAAAAVVRDALRAGAAFGRVAARAGFFRAAVAAGALAFRAGLVLRVALAGVRAFEPLAFFTVLALRAVDRVALVAFGFLASPRFGM